MASPRSESEVSDRAKVVALSLMRMALALLDRVGEPLAAVRLQHAIDTVKETTSEP